MPGRPASALTVGVAGQFNRQCCLAAALRVSCRPVAFLEYKSCRNGLPFSTRTPLFAEGRSLKTERESVEKRSYDDVIAQDKEKPARAPWHREGSNVPPIQRERSAGAMKKGKLLTTPSRLLKLIIPLTTLDHNEDRKTVEPLALLVHPQQPLSYLERLIQSELPMIKTEKGQDKIPAVYFRAEDAGSEDEMNAKMARSESEEEDDGLEETHFDGKVEKTGVLNSKKKAKGKPEGKSTVSGEDSSRGSSRGSSIRGGPGEGGVETYSPAGREGSESKGKFVRWSSSTEIGDFIRDAARGKEFAVEIEGAREEIRVGVPSFNDRTHYLRQRLRRISDRISEQAAIKKKCDMQAHRSAQRVALTGFAGMLLWWSSVYYFTFQTDLGWDTMEPVTYLVGLSGLMCGYLWFLYHNREVSYRSAMNLTISRRQGALYQKHGFDLHRWEELVREGNTLRSEIKAIASEYDVEWHEQFDERDQAVTQALKKHRDQQRAKNRGSSSKDDADDRELDLKPEAKTS